MAANCKPAELLHLMSVLSMPTCTLIPLDDYLEMSVGEDGLSWFPDVNGQRGDSFGLLAAKDGLPVMIHVPLNSEGLFDVMDIAVDRYDAENRHVLLNELIEKHRQVESHLYWLADQFTVEDKVNGMMECIYYLLEIQRKNKEEALAFLGHHCLLFV